MDKTVEKSVISILVKNQPGVLSRISALFSRRGYNIDGLSVCATENEDFSRMTITVTASGSVVRQIVSQLEKQVDVERVLDFSDRKVAFRELLLIKVRAGANERSQLSDVCTIFKAKVIDISQNSMMMELTGSTAKVDAFIGLLKDYEIIEMARTGGAALERGDGKLLDTPAPDEI